MATIVYWFSYFHQNILGTLLESHHEVVKRLRKLGYDFNKNGELRQFDQAQNKLTDKKFEFVVKKGDQDSNQVSCFVKP